MDRHIREAERRGDTQAVLVSKIRTWIAPGGDLDDYDWEATFSNMGAPDVVPPGSDVDGSAFTRDDVEHVYVAFGESVEGYGEWSGHAVFVLKDGRYGTAYGWCDTSGWG